MNKIKEAIILAGGLGTRLSDTVPGLPKSLAPVAGKPFLHYIMHYLHEQGIERFIFALGHKHEAIQQFLNEDFADIDIDYSIEEFPLGTGGAIKLACSKLLGEHAFVFNGDTMFKVDLERMSGFHDQKFAQCTLALKPMEKIDRYGVVEVNGDGVIIKFHEKRYYERGLINGGVYILGRSIFSKKKFPESFSFEKDYLEENINEGKIFGFVQDHYFIYIGIPEDYRRAQTEFLRFANSKDA